MRLISQHFDSAAERGIDDGTVVWNDFVALKSEMKRATDDTSSYIKVTIDPFYFPRFA